MIWKIHKKVIYYDLIDTLLATQILTRVYVWYHIKIVESSIK